MWGMKGFSECKNLHSQPTTVNLSRKRLQQESYKQNVLRSTYMKWKGLGVFDGGPWLSALQLQLHHHQQKRMQKQKRHACVTGAQHSGEEKWWRRVLPLGAMPCHWWHGTPPPTKSLSCHWCIGSWFLLLGNWDIISFRSMTMFSLNVGNTVGY